MKNLFTIGEVAALFSINIRTLHYYDSIGIPSSANLSARHLESFSGIFVLLENIE